MERLSHSIEEAAEMLSIGRTTAYSLTRSGELPTIEIGRRKLVAHADLVEYVERLREAS